MATLKNAKHERFAQELAKGKSATEAYKNAGYKPNRKNASRLMANEDIKGRLAELQGRAADKAVVTVESMIEEADRIQRAAVEEQQYSAAVSALIAKANLAGLWIERSRNENENTVYVISDEPMTEDEWAAAHVTKD
jgi:hypothetical protein